MALDIPIVTNPVGFLFFAIFVAGLVGLYSRKMSIAAFGAYLLFMKIAIKTTIDLFDMLQYIVLIMLCIFLAFRIYKFSQASEAGL